jgi:hypothetical protein
MRNVFIDRKTNQTIPFMKHSGDFEYNMSGDEAVVQEDVPLIGAWSDYTGSGGVDSRVQQHLSTQENSLQGTIPQIMDNAKLPNLSVVGTRQQTHRRRIIKRYVANDGK